MSKILDLIPSWAWVAALSFLSITLKFENVNLHVEVAEHEKHIAELDTRIARGNEAAAAQALAFESKARAAEQARTVREKSLVVDANGARLALDGLRSSMYEFSSKTNPKSSQCAGFVAAVTRDDLLKVSSSYVELAEKCDRHVNDIQALIAATPTNKE